jgi:Immunoglobulin-like domain of bacterial spore germination
VLGVPTSEPLAQGDPLRVCSLVNISSPNEGDQVSGKLTVTGVNNTFEGNVVVYLEKGSQRFAQKSTIGGYGPGRLFPWSVTLNLTDLAPGDYVLVATDGGDPAGTGRAWVDTRTVRVT